MLGIQRFRTIVILRNEESAFWTAFTHEKQILHCVQNDNGAFRIRYSVNLVNLVNPV
jgi:hypothetical protein